MQPAYRLSFPLIAGTALVSMLSGFAQAGYEAPNPAYDAPSNYYSGATGTGAALKSQLKTIISTGFVAYSYGDARYILDDLWRDPNNANNVILIYNGASVSGSWDAGITWNREHVWPDSKLGVNTSNSTVGAASDLFELAPANPSINSSRSNSNFGPVNGSGNYGYQTGLWFPSNAHKGDVARSMFYMATRYSNGTSTPSANNLTLVNGNPGSTYQLGDLQSLLRWHYTDGVDNFERRKNDLNYDSYQKNRNPYIDHPEYVWSVFGGGSNNSQLTASASEVSLGRVIKGTALGTANVTLDKAGSNPTTYDVLATGSAATVAAGAGQTFDYNAQSRIVSVGLSGGTATAGLKTGTVIIDNTDLTSGGAGLGSADANDVITVSATVLEHSNASFAQFDQNSLSIDLGDFGVGAPAQLTLDDIVRNLEATVGFTASLDLDDINPVSGQTSAIDVDGLFTSLAGGQAGDLLVTIDALAAGDYTATYELLFSDENIAGGSAFGSETLHLTLSASVVPEPGAIGLLAVGSLAVFRRCRRLIRG